MSKPYIGPERRIHSHPGRRTFSEDYSRACRATDENPERRTGALDRRQVQDGIAGVIIGMNADQMRRLADLWQAHESGAVKYPDALAALRNEPAPVIPQAPEASNLLDDFTRGYLEAALWLATDEKENQLDERYTIADFTDATKKAAREICQTFIEDNEGTIDLYADAVETPDGDSAWSYAGHDLWITCNGHGAGFWSRGLGDVGERLTDAARKLGESNVWETSNELEIGI
jgi:hypothetical protein